MNKKGSKTVYREGFVDKNKLLTFDWDSYVSLIKNIDTNLIERTNIKKLKLLQLRAMIGIMTYTHCRPQEVLQLKRSDIRFIEGKSGDYLMIVLKNMKHKTKWLAKTVKKDSVPFKKVPIRIDIEKKHKQDFDLFIEPIIRYILTINLKQDDLIFANWNRHMLWYYFIKGTYYNNDTRTGLNIYAIKHISIQRRVVDRGFNIQDMQVITGHRNINNLMHYYTYSDKNLIDKVKDE